MAAHTAVFQALQQQAEDSELQVVVEAQEDYSDAVLEAAATVIQVFLSGYMQYL